MIIFKCWEILLKGDEQERNHRVKLIPFIAEESRNWMNQRAHLNPLLIGEHIKLTSYYQGKDYLEIDYDISSGSMAIKNAFEANVIVDWGIVLQAETRDQLPEKILGCIHCSNFELSKAEKFPTSKSVESVGLSTRKKKSVD